MNKFYLFCSIYIFSNSIFALETPNWEKLETREIGTVIKSFLPDSDAANIFWNYKHDDPSIIWLHKPYIEQQDKTIRKGIFRSNVGGVKTTILWDREYELPWSIIYEGGLAKFGVTEIHFHPNLPNITITDSTHCFGVDYKNCNFNPIQSLERVGVNSKMICRDDTGAGSNFDKVYLLTANNKKPTYAIYSMSTGSGGSTNDFTLMLNTTEEYLCDLIK